MDLLPRFKKCQWGIEVALASSKAGQLLEPVVKLKIYFQDEDEPVEMRMSMEQFGDFRMKTAQALKSVSEIEQNKIMQQPRPI